MNHEIARRLFWVGCEPQARGRAGLAHGSPVQCAVVSRTRTGCRAGQLSPARPRFGGRSTPPPVGSFAAQTERGWVAGRRFASDKIKNRISLRFNDRLLTIP